MFFFVLDMGANNATYQSVHACNEVCDDHPGGASQFIPHWWSVNGLVVNYPKKWIPNICQNSQPSSLITNRWDLMLPNVTILDFMLAGYYLRNQPGGWWFRGDMPSKPINNKCLKLQVLNRRPDIRLIHIFATRRTANCCPGESKERESTVVFWCILRVEHIICFRYMTYQYNGDKICNDNDWYNVYNSVVPHYRKSQKT